MKSFPVLISIALSAPNGAVSQTENVGSIRSKQQSSNRNIETYSKQRKIVTFDHPLHNEAAKRHAAATKKKDREEGYHPDLAHLFAEAEKPHPNGRELKKQLKNKKAESKSGKASKPGNARSKSGKDIGKRCEVTITNLSFEQEFGEIFVMVGNKSSQEKDPLFKYGSPASPELAALAQDLDTSELVQFYDNKNGVDKVHTIDDFGSERKYLNGGGTVQTTIYMNDDYNRLTIAAGFPFANDGVVALDGGIISDGAEFILTAIDAGVEANLQTCWSVPAEKDDFPPNSACGSRNQVTDKVGGLNDNSVSGEGFVHTHRGIQDLDGSSDLDDLLLLECGDFEETIKSKFAEYFIESNYDDEMLLCKAVTGLGDCAFRTDDDFIEYVKENDDLTDEIFKLVRNSDNYKDFCDKVEDVNKGVSSIFVTLEPTLFDFRNPMAKVEVSCRG